MLFTPMYRGGSNVTTLCLPYKLVLSFEVCSEVMKCAQMKETEQYRPEVLFFDRRGKKIVKFALWYH